MENILQTYKKIIREYQLPLLSFKRGQFIFKEGDRDDSVYYIETGEIFILKDKWVLWSAKPKELIGISSLFSGGENYRFTAKVSEDCSLYKIPNEVLTKTIMQNAIFSRFIMNMLCDRINKTNGRVKGLLEYPSRNRLIYTLISKTKETGSETIPYQVNDLADMVGVSPRLIRSNISELEDRNMIRRTRDTLKILDLRGLEIIAENKK